MANPHRPKRRNVDATGRSRGGEAHVRMDRWTFDCPAYRSLAPGPRALLWELIRRHNGSNNGRIGLGVREAAKAVNVRSTETVRGYFAALIDRGFIVATRLSGFNLKAPEDRMATEWALTALPVGDQPASKAFMQWQSGNSDGTDISTVKCGISVPKGSNDRPPPSAPCGISVLTGRLATALACG